MKKHFIFLMVFVIVTGVMPSAVDTAYAETNFETYLYDDFESIAAGRHPLYREGYWYMDNLRVQYGGKIEVVKEGNNKFLSIYTIGKGEGLCNVDPSLSGKINYVDRNFVISGRYRVSSTTRSMGMLLSNGSNKEKLLSFENGQIKCMGNAVQAYTAKQWYRIHVLVNVLEQSATIVIDGANKGSFALNHNLMETFQEVRFYLSGDPAKNAMTSLHLDDIRIYEGSAVRDDTEFANQPSRLGLSDYSDLTKIMKNSLTVVAGKKEAASGLGKLQLSSAAAVQQEDAFVAIADAMNYLGIPYQYKEDILYFEYGGKKYRLEINNGLCSMEGQMYLSLKSLAKMLNKRFTICSNTIAIFSSHDLCSMTEEQANKIRNYILGITVDASEDELFFPTKLQIQQDFEKTSKNQHPRIMATKEDFSRIIKATETDGALLNWCLDVISTADTYLKAPVYTYQVKNGQMYVQGAMERFEALGMAYNLMGDLKYFRKAYEDMEAIIQFETWHPESYIVLSNMIRAMSIAYDWFYNAMTPQQRAKIANGIMEKGLRYALEGYRREATPGESDGLTRGKLQWLNDTSNWSAVGNGDNVLGAIAVFDEFPEESAEIIESAMPCLENFYTTTAPDGGNVEGVGYWEYAMIHYINMVAAMEKALGTEYGRFTESGIEKSGYFPVYMQNEQGAFNFSDSDNVDVQSPLYMYFAMKNNDKTLAALRMKAINSGVSEPTVYDILWYRADLFSGGSSDLPKDRYFRGVESGSFRDSFDKTNSMFFAFHGGANYANHSHADSGNFVLYANGQRWIEDLGKDKLTYYNPNNISFTSNQLYRIRAEGHNVMVFNPDQSAGQPGYFARVSRFESEEVGGLAVMDLTETYYQYVNEYKRGYMLTDNRTRAVVQDKFSLKTPSNFYWFVHTRADIEVAADGKSALFTLGGQKLMVQLHSDNDALKFGVMEAAPLATSPQIEGQADNSGYRKLYISAAKVRNAEFAVSFVPVVDGQEPAYVSNGLVTLDCWSVGETFEAEAKDSSRSVDISGWHDDFETAFEERTTDGVNHNFAYSGPYFMPTNTGWGNFFDIAKDPRGIHGNSLRFCYREYNQFARNAANGGWSNPVLDPYYNEEQNGLFELKNAGAGTVITFDMYLPEGFRQEGDDYTGLDLTLVHAAYQSNKNNDKGEKAQLRSTLEFRKDGVKLPVTVDGSSAFALPEGHWFNFKLVLHSVNTDKNSIYPYADLYIDGREIFRNAPYLVDGALFWVREIGGVHSAFIKQVTSDSKLQFLDHPNYVYLDNLEIRAIHKDLEIMSYAIERDGKACDTIADGSYTFRVILRNTHSAEDGAAINPMAVLALIKDNVPCSVGISEQTEIAAGSEKTVLTTAADASGIADGDCCLKTFLWERDTMRPIQKSMMLLK